MSMIMTAQESFTKVLQSAEKIRNDSTQVFPEAASFGDTIRQGDVFITLIESVPANFGASKTVAQLAPGTTKGSRHILDKPENVEMFVSKDADILTGPVIKVNSQCTVTHPEHGDWVLNKGVYEVTYERAFAKELRRQRD